MSSSGEIVIGRFKLSRIWQHVLFWLAAYIIMIVVYGYSKPSYLVAARNNLFYTPVHIIYFYVLACWLVPRFLLRRRYLLFFVLLILVFFGAIYITRIVDVVFVDPYEIRVFGNDAVWYAKRNPGFWDKVFDPFSFFGALKGVNLIVWFGLAIKLFKLWAERNHAALQAELNFLKGQIHPHFLFNTLNNLYALTLSRSAKAPEVVLGLSDMMRYMLYECNAHDVDLAKDVRMLVNYTELEKIRYEERLDLSFSINGRIEKQQIAPLLLLPLVENAFKHGTSEKLGQAWISIDLQVTGNFIKFKVANSKPEFIAGEQQHSGHIGLNNLRKRLELLYPDAHKLKIFDEEDMYLSVLELDLGKAVKLSA